MCHQDRESFIGHTSKLLCLHPEILCVGAWYAMCFRDKHYQIMADLSEGMWNLTFQPQQTSYLHCHNAYGHQTWQGGDLSRGAPTHKIT